MSLKTYVTEDGNIAYSYIPSVNRHHPNSKKRKIVQHESDEIINAKEGGAQANLGNPQVLPMMEGVEPSPQVGAPSGELQAKLSASMQKQFKNTGTNLIEYLNNVMNTSTQDLFTKNLDTVEIPFSTDSSDGHTYFYYNTTDVMLVEDSYFEFTYVLTNDTLKDCWVCIYPGGLYNMFKTISLTLGKNGMQMNQQEDWCQQLKLKNQSCQLFKVMQTSVHHGEWVAKMIENKFMSRKSKDFRPMVAPYFCNVTDYDNPDQDEVLDWLTNPDNLYLFDETGQLKITFKFPFYMIDGLFENILPNDFVMRIDFQPHQTTWNKCFIALGRDWPVGRPEMLLSCAFFDIASNLVGGYGNYDEDYFRGQPDTMYDQSTKVYFDNNTMDVSRTKCSFKREESVCSLHRLELCMEGLTWITTQKAQAIIPLTRIEIGIWSKDLVGSTKINVYPQDVTLRPQEILIYLEKISTNEQGLMPNYYGRLNKRFPNGIPPGPFDWSITPFKNINLVCESVSKHNILFNEKELEWKKRIRPEDNLRKFLWYRGWNVLGLRSYTLRDLADDSQTHAAGNTYKLVKKVNIPLLQETVVQEPLFGYPGPSTTNQGDNNVLEPRQNMLLSLGRLVQEEAKFNAGLGSFSQPLGNVNGEYPNGIAGFVRTYTTFNRNIPFTYYTYDPRYKYFISGNMMTGEYRMPPMIKITNVRIAAERNQRGDKWRVSKSCKSEFTETDGMFHLDVGPQGGNLEEKTGYRNAVMVFIVNADLDLDGYKGHFYKQIRADSPNCPVNIADGSLPTAWGTITGGTVPVNGITPIDSMYSDARIRGITATNVLPANAPATYGYFKNGVTPSELKVEVDNCFKYRLCIAGIYHHPYGYSGAGRFSDGAEDLKRIN